MSFIKKNVNLGLLFLIVASLIAFSAFSVYYQNKFKELNEEYTSKLDQLEQITMDLGLKKQALDETSSELNIKNQKVDEFGTQYNDLKVQKEAVDKENTILDSELSDTLRTLAIKSQNLLTAQTELQQTKQTLVITLTELEDVEFELQIESSLRAEAQAELLIYQGQN